MILSNKKLVFATISLVLIVFLSGCTQSADSIVVIGRDEASGTRGAFDELVLDKADPTSEMKQMASNTVVHDTVAITKLAIGYVGLGYIDAAVKALAIDGVMPSKSTVIDLSYPIARDLNFFTDGNATGVAKEFIDFILSNEGQALVAEEGFVDLVPTGPFTVDTSFPSGTKLTIAGSTTVLPIATACAAAYMELNSNVEITVSGGGSSTGVKQVGEGTVGIGMASREMKSSEIDSYPTLVKNVVAKDGIAIVVHPDNEVSGMTLDTVKGIYLGDFTTWTEVKAETDTTTASPIWTSISNLIAIFTEGKDSY
jgi:phosphate transport system substrate-binding protein